MKYAYSPYATVESSYQENSIYKAQERNPQKMSSRSGR